MLSKIIVLISLLSLHVFAQGDLAGVLTSQPDLSNLLGLAALIPNIVTTLANAPNITILAPTNAAFAALPNNSLEGVAALLSNHVIQGYYNSSSIPDRTPAFVQTLLNSSISNGAQPFTNITGGQYIGGIKNGADVDVISGGLNIGRVVQADIALESGIVIHKIDSVNRFGPTVQKYALGTGNTVVNQAIQAVGLSSATGVNSTTPAPLNAADLTFFLPKNQAFANIGSVVAAADNATITSVLAYHVPQNVLFSTRLSNTSVTTLQGTNLTVTVTDGATFVNDAKVILANGILFNGVAHIIDAVMNPANATAVTNRNSDAAARVAFANATTVTSLGLTTISAPATTTFTTPTLLTTLAPIEGGASGSGNSAMGSSIDLLAMFAATFGILIGAIFVL